MSAARLIVLCLWGAFASACASDPAAMKQTFDLGLKAYDSGDYPKAYQTWTSIEDVDLAALRNVAVMLRTGKGVAQNPQRALELMERAAEAGLPTAQADLADMLIKGEAGPPDPKAAFELGKLYEAGTGVEKNIEAARRLYRIAAAAGVADAAQRLAALPP